MVFTRGWIIDEADKPLAMGRLHEIVAFLTRQRWRQRFLENSCAGLLWGLAGATASVVIVRLTALETAVSILVASILALALAAASLKTWFDRPDKQQVAILADVQLRLKQRLSTAWEFAQRNEDPELAQYLAIQAVNQRYPARNQPVFPMRATMPAKLLPLAVLLLILVSAIDLPRFAEQATPLLVDAVLVTEGARLRAFAAQMQARAEREDLPRSTAQADNPRRLGARMESGSLSRVQALHRLKALGEALSEQRRAALADAGDYGSGALRQPHPSSGGAARLRGLLEQLMQGRMTASELQASAGENRGLSTTGITPEALQRALDNWNAGQPEALQEIVSQLSRAERATQDAEELDKAARRVAQVRENLGDNRVPGDDSTDEPTVAIIPDGDVGRISDSPFRPLADEDELDEGARHGAGAGSGSGPRQAAQSLNRRAARDDATLKPQSQFRDGASFSAEARVLPRAGQPVVAITRLDAQFAAQVEEVLAQEQYPSHQKDYLRRYFLELSQGAAGDTPKARAQQ